MRLGPWVLAFATSCASAGSRPDPVSTARPSESQITARVARVVDSFHPQGTDSAIVAFRAEVPPADSGGVCRTSRTTGSGATLIVAEFHARDSTNTIVSFMFDSAGSLVRFADTRGSRPFRTPPNATQAQFDSVRRLSEANGRRTSISFDFAADHALAFNSGGGREDEGIVGTVRRFENLETLGPPTERIKRIRRFCGI
jgi:hypothetical protein